MCAFCSAAGLATVAECTERDPAGLCLSTDDRIVHAAVLCSETFEGVAGFATRAECNGFFDKLAHGIHSDPLTHGSLFACSSSQRGETTMGPRQQPIVSVDMGVVNLSRRRGVRPSQHSWEAAHPSYTSALGTCGQCSGHVLSAIVKCD